MKQRKFKRILILFLGLTFIIIGLLFLSKSKYKQFDNKKQVLDFKLIIEENNVSNNEIVTDYLDDDVPIQQESINEESDESIASIKIPKIGLEQKLFPINSVYNDVNKNVKILKESSMPDVENSNLILASHAGSSDAAYFSNLKELKIGDIALIFYKNVCYKYEVYKIFEVDKDGEIVINRNNKDKYLTLITCKLGTKKQIVVICKLIY